MHAISGTPRWPAGSLGVVALILAGVVACDPYVPREPPPATVQPERIPRPIDPGVDNESKNLLQLYAARPPITAEESETWRLPFQGKRIAVAMLISAALDRPEDFPLVFTETAMWGLPDRRRVGARPVFDGDRGETLLAALRKAAQRFPETATWTSQPVLPGLQESYRVGAEPMWTYWSQGDEHLVTAMVVVGGVARIDYVGFWEDGPIKGIDTSGWGAPPPFIPKARTERITLPGE